MHRWSALIGGSQIPNENPEHRCKTHIAPNCTQSLADIIKCIKPGTTSCEQQLWHSLFSTTSVDCHAPTEWAHSKRTKLCNRCNCQKAIRSGAPQETKKGTGKRGQARLLLERWRPAVLASNGDSHGEGRRTRRQRRWHDHSVGPATDTAPSRSDSGLEASANPATALSRSDSGLEASATSAGPTSLVQRLLARDTVAAADNTTVVQRPTASQPKPLRPPVGSF